MTARFKAYRDLNREIDLQIERLEQMEAKVGSPSTPNLSGMPKGSSFQHDRIADTVARIADLLSEIDSLIAERDAEQKALEALIRRLPNADRRLVLRLRYLDSEDWEDVLFIAYGGKPDFNEKYDNYKQRVFRHTPLETMRLQRIYRNKSSCCSIWRSIPVCEKVSYWRSNGPILISRTMLFRFQRL